MPRLSPLRSVLYLFAGRGPVARLLAELRRAPDRRVARGRGERGLEVELRAARGGLRGHVRLVDRRAGTDLCCFVGRRLHLLGELRGVAVDEVHALAPARAPTALALRLGGAALRLAESACAFPSPPSARDCAPRTSAGVASTERRSGARR